MCQFIESIKVYKKQPCLLEWHQKRMNETFLHYGLENPLRLIKIFEDIQHLENKLSKWRILYDLHGNFSMQLLPYSTSEIKNFELIINNTIEYSLKSENRGELDAMKATCNAEEIIVVKNNQITDTSYSNLLFKKNELWFTPKSYLLNGVQRQFLLSKNLIQEADITLDNLANYSHFRIINAMNSFDSFHIYPIEKIINLQ